MKSYLNDSAPLFDSPEQLLQVMSDYGYTEFTTLMSSIEVLLLKEGSCHDQVMFEISALSDIGLRPKAKFIMSVDEYGDGEETHSFAYYKQGRYWYWFENAWEDLAGIHKYHSEEELINSVVYAFGRRNGFDKIYLADFNPDEHTIGEDLETFVDICMNSAEEYKIE